MEECGHDTNACTKEHEIEKLASQHSSQQSKTSHNSSLIDLEDSEHGESESDPKRKRKKTSTIWNKFKEITLRDGTRKAQCIHCKDKLAIIHGATTQFHRHLKICPSRQLSSDKQSTLSFKPIEPGSKIGSLTNFKYNKEKVRELMAKAIIVHEYPFLSVEHEFLKQVFKELNPLYEDISRITAKNDVMKIYENEKKKLKNALKKIDRISLTTDMWTSNQTIGYMSITGHFLDLEWNLHHAILNFCEVSPPHTGIILADAIHQRLIDWGIEDKISTITLDNATANDVLARTLMDFFRLNGKILLDGRIFHVRCCAHILNLIVQDGLSEIKNIIGNIRMSVKYIKSSPSKLHKFKEIVSQLQLSISKGLCLDVPTRWNSTYLMLQSALAYREVFSRFQIRDPNYMWLPSIEDWKKAEEVCQILEVFYEITNVFSGRKYPTANLFLPEIWKIKEILNEKLRSDNSFICAMALKMADKFDKYWGSCNLLMAIAAVLDPRFKMVLLRFCFPKIYPGNEAIKQLTFVNEALHNLFNEYKDIHEREQNLNKDVQMGSNSACSNNKGKSRGRAEFDIFVKAADYIQPIKSDLDIYLEEGVFVCDEDSDSGFDALSWWKQNALKYRVLSKMAHDILAIPISTVASESAFSTGGRVISDERSSLASMTVEALICTGDWLRNAHKIEKTPNVGKL